MPEAREGQVLFEAFSSPRGRVSLGRLDVSAQAGRIVMLREIGEATRAQIAPAVRTAATFTHPGLLKVLGLVSDSGRYFVASEYVPGVSLYELVATIRRRQLPMAADAAVRIVIDALRLLGEARSLLSVGARHPPRLLYADCIWIAEFGETMLAEPGIAAQLVPSTASTAHDPNADSESQDVLAAAVELFHLATGRLMTGDMCASARLHLSAPLAEVLEEIFAAELSIEARSAPRLAAALSALPPVLVGSEGSVTAELRRLAGDLLDERRRKLEALRGGGAGPDIDSPTRVYSSPPSGDDTDAGDETTRKMEVRHAKGALRRGVADLRPAALTPVEDSPSPPAPSEVPRRAPPVAAAPAPRRSRHLLLERALLGVLLVLIAIAFELALGDPARVREVYAALRAWH